MATTTNYGWTTPDDTALVKDGAAAIRTLGSSVDTTTKNLNPETTLGDIAYRSSTANVNTRLPLGTAGQVLKVNSGATAPEWATDATGMSNPMTTTGDTIYSSSGSTPARLGIGSTGQVLTVAGGVPSWATASSGGMTLISTTTLSGSTVSLTSIPGTYNTLQLLIFGSTAGSQYRYTIRPNGTTANFRGQQLLNGSGGLLNNTNFNVIDSDLLSSNTVNAYSITIYNYASATAVKPVQSFGTGLDSGSVGIATFNAGIFNLTSAITSLDIASTQSFTAGTALLYGVK